MSKEKTSRRWNSLRATFSAVACVGLSGLAACGGGTTYKTPAPAATPPAPAASTPAPTASAPSPVASAPGPVASAPAPVASAPAPSASAPAPSASAPAPAPSPSASAPAPAASAPSGTVQQLSAQQMLDVASAAYRNTKMFDLHMRFAARLGSNMVVNFSKLTGASFTDQVLNCSKTGSYTTSWAKASGATATLGWGIGDALSITFNDCRFDDGGRLHGQLRVVASQPMTNIGDGAAMLFSLSFANMAMPLDGSSTALASGTVLMGSVYADSQNSISANYSASAGYAVSILDEGGTTTATLDTNIGINGATSQSSARETRSFDGTLRTRRPTGSGFAADSTLKVVIAPQLVRTTGAADWQPESSAGVLRVTQISNAGSAAVQLSPAGTTATVSLDHTSDGTIDFSQNVSMTEMGAGTAVASSGPPSTPPPGTSTTPTATPTAPVIGTVTSALTREQALAQVTSAYSANRLMDAQLRSLINVAAITWGIYSDATVAGFSGLEIACSVSGRRVLGLAKAIAGPSKGFNARDAVTIDYQNCTEFQGSVWNGRVQLDAAGAESRTAVEGTVFTFEMSVSNLTMPGAMFGGQAVIDGTYSVISRVLNDFSSNDIGYSLWPNAKVSVGDIRVSAGAFIATGARVALSYTAQSKSIRGGQQSHVGSGNLVIERTGAATTRGHHSVNLTRQLLANGSAGGQTGTISLRRELPIGLSFSLIREPLITATVNNQDVVITVDQTNDGSVDLTVDTSLGNVGG